MWQESDLKQGAQILVDVCAQVKESDKVLIVADEDTLEVSKYLVEAARAKCSSVALITSATVYHHGAEPEHDVAEQMKNSTVILGATKFSMAHTKARSTATSLGARYLSLPDYNLEQLASKSLTVDFKKWASVGIKLKKLFDNGSTARIITELGTQIKVFFKGRIANCCPGFCEQPGTLGSPPDIETNVSPIEEKSEGVIVVDGSIPCQEIGLLKNPVKFYVTNGMLSDIDTSCAEGKALQKIFDAQDPKARILAEFGIGLNPMANLCGRMLEDEGCLGTIHFGFGSNATVGGKNSVNFHLDFVIRHPTVWIDDNMVIEKGNLLIE